MIQSIDMESQTLTDRLKDELSDIINTKLEEKFTSLKQDLFDHITNKLLNDVEMMIQDKLTALEMDFDKKIMNLEQETNSLKMQISHLQMNQDEQQDRSLRSTPIFRKIPYDSKTEDNMKKPLINLPAL